jgi:hypothetical protein
MNKEARKSHLNMKSNFNVVQKEYYIVSSKWSLLNEQFVTFVREGAYAYCYNLSWAGPMSLCDAEKFVKEDSTVIVNQSAIAPFLVNVRNEESNCWMLPNTDEVRKVIGLRFAV